MKTSNIQTSHALAIIKGWVDPVSAGTEADMPNEWENGDSVALTVGDVVVLDSDGTITRTTTAQDTRPVGVVLDDISVGEYGPVVWQGPVDQINTTASVTAGHYAETSTTAGDATSSSTRRVGSFGYYTGTGSNPSAFLFGGGGGSGVPATGSLPWFVVTDYGATNDNTTDDLAAINLAIADLNSAGEGVLYFPAGAGYRISDALTAITATGTIMGDGLSASVIWMEDADEAVFTISADSVVVTDLAIVFDGAGTPTAGSAAIATTTGKGVLCRYKNLNVQGFYINLDLSYGYLYVIESCYIFSPVQYGLRHRNLDSVDAGDSSIEDTVFSSTTHTPAAAIRMESSGGLKIMNCKINGTTNLFVDGIQGVIASSSNTSVLLLANTSIENVSGDAIDFSTTGTGRFHSIHMTGCQVGLYSNNAGRALKVAAASAGGLVSGGIGLVVVAGCSFLTTGTARAATEFTNVDSISLAAIELSGFNALYTQSGSTNIHDSTAASGSVATDAIWDAAGDLAVGSGANTAARLAIGAAGGALSRINGVVAWNSGTSFPTAAAGDRYWRTDDLIEYTYDGTRWVSTQLYIAPMVLADAILPLTADTTSHRIAMPIAGTQIRVYDFWVSFFVSGGTALSASHAWLLTFQSIDSTDRATVNINSGASNAWRTSAVQAVNVSFATTEYEFELFADKTGTPGSLYLTPMFSYRIQRT